MAAKTSPRPLPEPARFGLYLAFFALAFFRFWDHAVIFRDSFVFFAPNKFMIGEALKHGRLDLWNPWVLLGLPLAGEVQAGLFYPLNLLFAALPFGVAHRLFILLHYPLAAYFMDLYLRGRGRTSHAAVFGALAFALSGYLVSQHGMVRMAIGGAWLPLVLYCFERARAERFFAAAAGAALAATLIASDPETPLFAAVIGAAILLGHAALTRRAAPALNLAIAAVAALALAAIVVLPMREMLNATTRAAGVSLDKAVVFSFHPAELIELLWPTPFGVSWPDYNYWGHFVIGMDPARVNVPWSATNYLGLPALLLAGMAVAARPRRNWAPAAAAILFLLLAMGRWTPIYGWLHAVLPVFDSIRYPSKFVIFVTFYLASLAAAGADELLGWLSAGDRRAFRAGLVYLAAVLLIGGLMLWLWPAVMDRKTLYRAGSPLYLDGLAHFRSTFRVWAGLSLALAAAWLLVASGRLIARLGRPLCLVILVADWWLGSVAIMPVALPEIYSFTPIAERAIRRFEPPGLGRFRIFEGRLSFTDRNEAALPGLTPAERKELWFRNILFPNLTVLSGIESLRAYDSYDFRDDGKLLDRDAERRVLEMFNVRYVIDQREGPVQGGEVVYEDRMNELRIVRLPGAWPRAYFVARPLPAADVEEARALLGRAYTARAAVIVGAEPTTADGGNAGGLVPATIDSYEPDRVRVVVEAPTPGWLVLSDRYFPGWSATVDGKPAEILPANVLARAVRVGPGRHEVEFIYRPRSVLIGELISLPAWGVFIGVWISWKRKSRKIKVKR